MSTWSPPPDWLRLTTIDAHAAGEPLRVVTGGCPEILGDTMLARRRYARETLDHLRTALLWEPRGHADMYGALLTPPVSPGADVGVLFMHNEGYSTMCGHGIIALVTVMLETGLVPMRWPETLVTIDTPAGPVHARAQIAGGRVQQVRFRNVPAFVVALDETVDVAGLGRLRYDLAFGGAFYAFVAASAVGLQCAPRDLAALVDAGTRIKAAIAAARRIVHPVDEDLGFLYGTIFVGPPAAPEAHSRHVCVFADGEVDRSPTGTGVSARLALLHARGELALDQTIVVESVIGTTFTGRIVETTTVGPYAAVVPEVGGRAFITGRHEFLVDPHDPLGRGFLLR
jgi:proline racemase